MLKWPASPVLMLACLLAGHPLISMHHSAASTLENQLATKRILNICDAKRVKNQECWALRRCIRFTRVATGVRRAAVSG
jgi:hypothetical protein